VRLSLDCTAGTVVVGLSQSGSLVTLTTSPLSYLTNPQPLSTIGSLSSPGGCTGRTGAVVLVLDVVDEVVVLVVAAVELVVD
jgi:hypothetical protein